VFPPIVAVAETMVIVLVGPLSLFPMDHVMT
jgi:hypothetical protein